MNEWAEVYAALSARTALEEVLEWDADLVDYLLGAWAVQGVGSLGLEQDAVIALMVGCLPKDKQNHTHALVNWLKDEYNLLNRGSI